MINRILLFSLCLHLMGCTPTQRLNRLIGNHPYLANSIVRDTVLTVVEIDTVYIPEKTIDTVFAFNVDTFVVNDSGVIVVVTKEVDRWRIKTKVEKQTVYIKDTVKVKFTETVNVFKVEPVKSSDIWKWRKQGALWLFLFLLLLIIIVTAVRIYLKGQIPFVKW